MIKIKTKIIISLLILILFPLLLKGYNINQNNEMDRINEILEKNDKTNINQNFSGTYKIGTVQTLTGKLSYQGRSIVDAIELYFDIINREGGIYNIKVELIVYDDSNNPSIALEKTKRLVEQDRVNAIIGGTSVSTALSTISYINRSNLPYLHFGGGSVELVKNAGSNMFFLQPTHTMEAMIMNEFATRQFYANDFFVVYQNDEMGIRSRNTARNYAIFKRNRIIHEARVDNNTNYQRIAQDIAQTRPDAVFMFTYAAEANEILKYLRGYNVNTPVILPSFNLDYITIGTIGRENWNNTYCGRWFKSHNTEEIREFVRIFNENKFSFPNMYHSIGWALAELMAEARKRAPYSGGLRGGLASLYSWNFGITSRIDFDNQYNVGIDSLYFVGFNNGEFYEYDTYVTPHFIGYYNEANIMGVIRRDFFDERGRRETEYILDENYKDTVTIISSQIENIIEQRERAIEIAEAGEDNQETEEGDGVIDNIISEIELAQNLIENQIINPLIGEDREINNNEVDDEDYLIEENIIDTEIMLAEDSQNLSDDLLLLFGEWRSVEAGEKLANTKYGGEILLTLRADNRFYMNIYYEDRRALRNANGYWEIEFKEDLNKILLDQFIPESKIVEAYFRIVNYGRTLEIIFLNAEDAPSLKDLNKETYTDEDYEPYILRFTRSLMG